jgi:hypothetical protein
MSLLVPIKVVHVCNSKTCNNLTFLLKYEVHNELMYLIMTTNPLDLILTKVITFDVDNDNVKF